MHRQIHRYTGTETQTWIGSMHMCSHRHTCLHSHTHKGVSTPLDNSGNFKIYTEHMLFLNIKKSTKTLATYNWSEGLLVWSHFKVTILTVRFAKQYQNYFLSYHVLTKLKLGNQLSVWKFFLNCSSLDGMSKVHVHSIEHPLTFYFFLPSSITCSSLTLPHFLSLIASCLFSLLAWAICCGIWPSRIDKLRRALNFFLLSGVHYKECGRHFD